NATGVFTNSKQTVTYVYEKADGAPVTVKYVDADGNELATSDTLNGKIDAPYHSVTCVINNKLSMLTLLTFLSSFQRTILVEPSGIEPLTSCVQSRRSPS
uniref:MucBP domain-containing protein n=1 Tax=Listeria monocytogenes TaxID=1639 RepID=UPI003204AF54